MHQGLDQSLLETSPLHLHYFLWASSFALLEWPGNPGNQESKDSLAMYTLQKNTCIKIQHNLCIGEKTYQIFFRALHHR